MLLGIKLIIYDLDGVLIDSNPAIRKSIKYSLQEKDLDYDLEKIMEHMGTPLHKIFEEIFRDEDKSKIPEAVNIYRDFYRRKGKDELIIQNKVMDTLRYFKRKRIKQSIASNSSRELMEPILKSIGIMNHIDLFVGVEDVKRPKPHPNILELIIKKMDISNKETVFVDDSSTGLTAGKKAGTHIVGITTGVHTTHQIKSVEPDFIITRLDELINIIKID